MKRIALLFGLAVAADIGTARAAEMYRWVDEAGRVHYSDTLPPPEARSRERRRLGDKPTPSTLPYA
ncbi:MAG TPA: DUF4124 domain-containing protein, partial [Burkholderiales bacterium]|nr:DUF4124 domain-containing protein [Burkholderiales bacterium]